MTTGTQTWPDSGRSISTQTHQPKNSESVILLKRNYEQVMTIEEEECFFQYNGESVDQFLIQLRKHKDSVLLMLMSAFHSYVSITTNCIYFS